MTTLPSRQVGSQAVACMAGKMGCLQHCDCLGQQADVKSPLSAQQQPRQDAHSSAAAPSSRQMGDQPRGQVQSRQLLCPADRLSA